MHRLDLDPGRRRGGRRRTARSATSRRRPRGRSRGCRRGRPAPRRATAVTSRGTRWSVGHQPVERRRALGGGRVEQVGAVEVQHVEEVRRDHDARRSSRCATPSPGRAAAGRRRRAPAPRRRARTTSPAATAPTSTTSGSRAVMSSSDRVATSTSSPERCTWIRMPSSFTSTATSAPRAGLGERRRRPSGRSRRASAAPGGRPRARSRPARRRPSNAARATATVEPASIAARRTAASGTSAADGQRLLHQRVERALAYGAGDHAPQPRLLVGGRAPEELGDRGRPRRLRSRPRQRRERLERLVHLRAPSASTTSAGGGQRRQPAPAQPGAPLPQRAADVGRHRLDLVGLGDAPAARRSRRPWPCATGWRRPSRRWRRRRRAACAHSRPTRTDTRVRARGTQAAAAGRAPSAGWTPRGCAASPGGRRSTSGSTPTSATAVPEGVVVRGRVLDNPPLDAGRWRARASGRRCGAAWASS